MPTLFSVVMATRDRPALFAEAIDSVLAQTHPDVEIIVVNDGSRPESVDAYQPIWDAARARLGERFQVHTLVHRPRGHGQSYSLNFGVGHARGDYVCFLDDDDKWTDVGHLARAAAAVGSRAAAAVPVDLYMANQTAWNSAGQSVGTLWLGTLADELLARGQRPDADGVFTVTVKDLMRTTGFCHLNCLVVRRTLFDQVGGMDEGIRWECDRDVFLKLVDRAAVMLHHPDVVSYHRVPDPSKSTNMTTALGMIEKRLLQALVMDRALVRSSDGAIRGHARMHKGYALKKIAEEYAASGDWASARFYAGQALGAAPGLKWGLFTLKCICKEALATSSRR